MATLTPEVKEMIKKVKYAHVATASKTGVPNSSAKEFVVIDDNTLAFACLWSDKTISNIKENPTVAISIIDISVPAGFQLKGKVTLTTTGKVFDDFVTEMARRKYPKPKCVALISVGEVYPLPPKSK